MLSMILRVEEGVETARGLEGLGTVDVVEEEEVCIRWIWT